MASRNEARKRLNSWKEIASFFERDERTVKRWEVERGLPVHRIPGQARSKIYADADELFEWMKSGTRGPRLSPESAKPAPEDLAPDPEPVESSVGKVEPSPELAVQVDEQAAVSTSGPDVQVSDPAPRRSRRFPGGVLELAAAGLALALILAIGGARLFIRRSPPAHRDPLAAELYGEGLHDWTVRTPASLTRAVDEFTQAIVREPQSPQAYVGLARCYNLLREYSDMPDAEAYPRAEAAINRALALDPSLAEAHTTLAFIKYYWNWDAAGAEREFRRAISLDPTDAVTRHWYANVLRVELRLPEALDQITRAQALDPGSSTIAADKGAILVSMGRVADGERILKHLEEVEPQQLWPHAYLADLYLERQNYTRFLVESKTTSTIKYDGARLPVLHVAEQGLSHGDVSQMLRSMLSVQEKLNAQGLISPYNIALTYGLLGDRTNTLHWLHKTVDQHDDSIFGALVNHSFSFLHGDPQFEFVRSVITGSGGQKMRPDPRARADV